MTSNIPLKSSADIAAMRVAGKKAASVLDLLDDAVQPGVTTEELNTIAHTFITEELKCIPAPLNYKGFPKSICTSINEVICHGIPNTKAKLKSGDIINIDVTIIDDGWHADTSRMYLVGEVAPHAERLVDVTRECMVKGIELVKPGTTLGDIGAAIQEHAHKHHYSVVREFCGHGIGRVFHEEPQVLHYGTAGRGTELVEGMVFTIEPMINQGKRGMRMLSDGWTAITKDRRLSAQWEHTIAVTAHGFEVLTLAENETLAS